MATGSNLNDFASDRLTSYATLSTNSFNTVNSAGGIARITGLAIAGGTGGTVKLQVAKFNTGTATVSGGSYMIARRLQ